MNVLENGEEIFNQKIVYAFFYLNLFLHLNWLVIVIGRKIMYDRMEGTINWLFWMWSQNWIIDEMSVLAKYITLSPRFFFSKFVFFFSLETL